jgi:hypothetical protein
MKKSLFLFWILISADLVSAPKINCDLDKFLQVIENAEKFCQQQDDDKAVQASLSEKLKVRDELYQFRQQFDLYLNECQNSKEFFDPKEYEVVFTQLLPLLKEVVRRLEDHLEKKHNWTKPRHFSRIAKPLVVTSSVVVSAIVLTKILEKAGAFSPEVSKKIYAIVGAGGAGVFGLWLAYNYRDVIARKLTCKS